jgi:hypothetical protein
MSGAGDGAQKQFVRRNSHEIGALIYGNHRERSKRKLE